jgi:hypothetical protein
MTTKKKIAPLVALASSALLLAACSSGTASDVTDVTPQPTSVATTTPETAEPEPTEAETPEAPQVEPEPENTADVDLGVKEAKAGDFIGVAVPQALLEAADPAEWNFVRESTGVVVEPEPNAQPTGEFLTVGEEDTDTFYTAFEVAEAGTGTISVSYTNPETGEVKNLSLTVNAS